MKAFADLCTPALRKRVYGWIRGMRFRHDDAEDLTQVVFVRAFSAYDQLRAKGQVSTWMYEITRTVVSDHLKMLGAKMRVPEDRTTPIERATLTAPSHESSVVSAVYVDDKLLSLPPRKAQVAALRMVGYTLPEAGRLLGLTPTTAAGYLRRLRHHPRLVGYGPRIRQKQSPYLGED